MYNNKSIFGKLPHLAQNLLITIFNTKQYISRHGGEYKKFRKYYSKAEKMDKHQLEKEVLAKRNSFLEYAKYNSPWYKDLDLNNLSDIGVLEKDDIVKHLSNIKTIKESKGVVSLTGGTTGASMKVIYTKSDVQERFAILDHFRAQHGYKLGKKTAWFSGKNLISEQDIKRGKCSHYDFINRIRFYSTFHISVDNFDLYWSSLNKFSPDFIVGFPSSVYEICQIADSRGLRLKHQVKVFFPTAETVLPKHREIIRRVFGCQLVDQYASSEGAPFILECTQGNLHIHPLTGIFEVVDEYLQPSEQGEMLVTSFTTRGTPLIRYRIGDSIKLSNPNKKCGCKSIFPLVDRIEGRSNDYILSPTNGKVNLGNISNSTKDINGIIKFQVIQESLYHVQILVVASSKFNLNQENKFIEALKQRFGPHISINLDIVDDIPNEKSGKFRIVKNLLEK